MSRDWIAAYVSTLRKPKYRRLSIQARAALFHIWLLAGGQEPEATWPDRAELEETLILDGWGDAGDGEGSDSAQGVVTDLLAAGWLDQDDDGRVLVHDWDQWQLAATAAARRAYERDRKLDWRRRREEPAGLPPAPPSTNNTGSTTQGHDITVSRNVPKRPGHVRDTGPAGIVPTEGDCRVCGGFVRGSDYGVRVGPGWIEHEEHPEDRVAAVSA